MPRRGPSLASGDPQGPLETSPSTLGGPALGSEDLCRVARDPRPPGHTWGASRRERNCPVRRFPSEPRKQAPGGPRRGAWAPAPPSGTESGSGAGPTDAEAGAAAACVWAGPWALRARVRAGGVTARLGRAGRRGGLAYHSLGRFANTRDLFVVTICTVPNSVSGRGSAWDQGRADREGGRTVRRGRDGAPG